MKELIVLCILLIGFTACSVNSSDSVGQSDNVCPHKCNGECWEKCPSGYYFICSDYDGGFCKPIIG